MDEATIRRLIEQVRSGLVEPDEVVARLRRLPFADLGFARVDHHRALRQGLAEAVYGPGKTPEQCAAIIRELLSMADKGPILLTRADDEQVAEALSINPGGQRHGATVVWRPVTEDRFEKVVIATAGTADLAVADECAITLRAHGLDAVRLNDVGVAGVHRLLASGDQLDDADAVIVVAGMEGALASLVGGLTAAPVVAVPTSAGYGTSFGGITALLAMLSSCAAGVMVVGIDNGFGAAYALLRMFNTRR
ncbi:MAG TPA: nickel pincer cofactor biosynthesis protein LarB [Acidimicrobiales bacterium]|nr:nickel pincer cofactor biosynthesis protein LarB [Acidimicrobiales bacterium]